YGPPVDGHRPSGTVLLKSLAEHFRGQAVGVVLSGLGQDGAEGAAAIDAAGGSVLIEDPAHAAVSFMPAAALKKTRAPMVAHEGELGLALKRLIFEPRGGLPWSTS